MITLSRERVLEPIISSMRRGTPYSRFDILDYLKDWDAVPLEIDGEHVATAIVKGTEIHFALVSDWRPEGTRGRIRSFLAPLLERRGYLTTRVRLDRPHEQKFVQRLGFAPTWNDENFRYYMLSGLPFERKER